MTEHIENHGRHLQRAIDTTTCVQHGVDEGVPCWTMPKQVEGAEGYYGSICGKRIRKAGFIGKISAASMRIKAPSRDEDPKSGPRRSFGKKTNDARSPRREKHRENSK